MTTAEMWLVFLGFAIRISVLFALGAIITRLLRPLWRRLGLDI